jgi:hypothetical protein
MLVFFVLFGYDISWQSITSAVENLLSSDEESINDTQVCTGKPIKIPAKKVAAFDVPR